MSARNQQGLSPGGQRALVDRIAEHVLDRGQQRRRDGDGVRTPGLAVAFLAGRKKRRAAARLF
jgi:hypothetical protein